MSKCFLNPLVKVVWWACFFSMVMLSASPTYSADTYAVSQTAEVTLAWDSNDPTPEGYRIYHRREGEAYNYSQPCWTGADTRGTVYNLAWDTTYYFVVRAFDGTLESADSEEVAFRSPVPETPVYSITTVADAHGSISPNGVLNLAEGTDQTFTITPGTGYHIADVRVDGVSLGPVDTYTFLQIDAHHTIEAAFGADLYTISAAAGAFGTISPEGDSGVAHGGSQTFTMAPDAGCHITSVVVDGVAMGALTSYTFANITSDHTISATFAVNDYQISASAGANGSVSPSGTTSVDHGGSQNYSIAPASGYHIADVLVDGLSVGAVASYAFTGVAADHTIHATFAIDAYTISASADANGGIAPAGAVSVPCGSDITYTITPNAGCSVADVTVDGVSIGSVASYTFAQVAADHTIRATFAAQTFTVTAAAGEHGRITPAGTLQLPMGASQTYAFTADAGYHIDSVLVDGQSMGAIQSYTFSGIDADHTLDVAFAENTPVKIWIEAEDGDLQWPMEIDGDENASAGGYVWVSEGTGNQFSPSDNSGYAEYHFDVPETGTYVIWGRQVSNDSASDSFFVAVDAQEHLVWHTKHGGQDVWTWDAVAVRDAYAPDYAASPVVYWLEAGVHTVRITQREDGTKLDRILITNQTDLTEPESTSLIEKMEYGEVELDQNWKRITFKKTFVNPVVISGPISLNGGDPAVVRIQNVDADGFEMRIQEWDYLDGDHVIEMVSYLVMEQGSYTLEDGTKIEAGVLQTGAAEFFEPVAFKERFNVVPVVLTAITSLNDTAGVTGRVTNIATDGFKYLMQEQELNANDHAPETLAYLAWEPSSGVLGEMTYVVGKTADAVKNKLYSIDFNTSFAASPAFLADMQTTDGRDTANVRYANKSETSVEVRIFEEKSKDPEMGHTSEVVGYMLFGQVD